MRRLNLILYRYNTVTTKQAFLLVYDASTRQKQAHVHVAILSRQFMHEIKF